MTLAGISVSYLRARNRGALLNVVVLALAVAAITLLVLTAGQLEERIYRDARGIDVVVGAKGSALQVVLSSVYHVDAPEGTIAWPAAQAIAARPGIRKSIPIAVVDEYEQFRIVGSNQDYIAHYQARLRTGTLWRELTDVLIGSDVARRTSLRVGSTFSAVHGADAVHDGPAYRVAGVLWPTGSVIDRLIVAELAGVWSLHPPPEPTSTLVAEPPPDALAPTSALVREPPSDASESTGALVSEPPPEAPEPTIALVSEPPPEDPRTITALLIQTVTPAAGAALLREIEGDGELRAASPAAESARLFGLTVAGMSALRGFALILVIAAALSLFIGLYSVLNERRYDLAIMRVLGASPRQLMALLLFEGALLTAIGAAAGLLLGHALTSLLGYLLRFQQISVTGWTWSYNELWIVAGALGVGVLAALLPAWRAYEADIAQDLARG